MTDPFYIQKALPGLYKAFFITVSIQCDDLIFKFSFTLVSLATVLNDLNKIILLQSGTKRYVVIETLFLSRENYS